MRKWWLLWCKTDKTKEQGNSVIVYIGLLSLSWINLLEMRGYAFCHLPSFEDYFESYFPTMINLFWWFNFSTICVLISYSLWVDWPCERTFWMINKQMKCCLCSRQKHEWDSIVLYKQWNAFDHLFIYCEDLSCVFCGGDKRDFTF